MQPEHLIYGGGATATHLHPLVVVWMLVAIALILTLRRTNVIVLFLLAFFTIPLGQVLVVGSLHFTVLRILILVGLARTLLPSHSESYGKFPRGFNAIDRVVVLWAVAALVIVSIQWMELDAFIKFVGDFLDSLGGYLVARYFIPDRDALTRTIKALALICLIQGACMVSEQFTHQNVFGFLGANEPAIRDGHVRAEGVLGSLQGGAFGGVLIPVFLWLWTEPKSKVAACAGLVGATAMVLASHASTSWMAYGAGLGALCFWPLRTRMRLVRWGLVALLAGLHLVMHGPVWSLIEKVDLTGGSSSYHRYMLVDNCIRHFSDWWLLGYKNYGDWGFDMWDLCNQFVVAALTGGLITLILFIAIYGQSFAAIGKARKLVEGDRAKEWQLWCLGSTMFANVIASFGINYMIQLEMLLFPLLACISIAAVGAWRPVLNGIAIPSPEQLNPASASTGSYLLLKQPR